MSEGDSSVDHVTQRCGTAYADERFSDMGAGTGAAPAAQGGASMDDLRFDGFARHLATDRSSRCGVFRVLGSATLGAAGGGGWWRRPIRPGDRRRGLSFLTVAPWPYRQERRRRQARAQAPSALGGVAPNEARRSSAAAGGGEADPARAAVGAAGAAGEGFGGLEVRETRRGGGVHADRNQLDRTQQQAEVVAAGTARPPAPQTSGRQPGLTMPLAHTRPAPSGKLAATRGAS